MNTENFTQAEIETMKSGFNRDRISFPMIDRMEEICGTCKDSGLRQLVAANIKFLGQIRETTVQPTKEQRLAWMQYQLAVAIRNAAKIEAQIK